MATMCPGNVSKSNFPYARGKHLDYISLRRKCLRTGVRPVINSAGIGQQAAESAEPRMRPSNRKPKRKARKDIPSGNSQTV